MRALTNQIIAGYELRELLGEGAIGSVYRGYNPRTNHHAAVKVLTNPASVAHPSDVERFMLEARTIASLQHPHIVPLYNYGTDRGYYFIVMQLLTGGTLQDRLRLALRQGQLPSPGEVAHLVNQIASALQYAHNDNVIHRDVKPTNVIFDSQGTPYLADFGIVKLTDVATWLTQNDMTMGTPAFMAPEQWRGEGITPATDQYALAVIAYELLSGKLPFEARQQHALMYKHFNELPPVITTLPEDVNAVLQRALAKTPEERYPTIAGFADALAQAVQGIEGQPTIFSQYKPPEEKMESSPPPLPPRQPQGEPVLKPLLIGMGLGTLVLSLCAGILIFTGLRALGQSPRSDEAPIIPTLPDATPLVIDLTAEALPEVIEAVTAEVFVTPLPLVLNPPPVVSGGASTVIDTADTVNRTVALNPAGTVMASGGGTGVIQLWDAGGGGLLRDIQGHAAVVHDLAFNPDGSLLASAGADGSVRVWDVNTGGLNATLSGHFGEARSVDFSPDGSLLVSTGADKTVRVWNVSTQTQQTFFQANNERVLGASFSPDGTRVATGWDNNTVVVWEIASSSQVIQLNGHSAEIRDAAFSPRGDVIASSSSDGTVRLWDVNTGQTLFTLNHGRGVFKVAFNADGSLLASGSSDNSVYVWSVATGERLARLDGHIGWVFDVDFYPDSMRVVSAGGDGMLRVWSLAE